MPLYTFHLYKADGCAGSFAVCTLHGDGDTFGKAGHLLEEHLTCDLVEVWDGDRAVVVRHRTSGGPPNSGSDLSRSGSRLSGCRA